VAVLNNAQRRLKENQRSYHHFFRDTPTIDEEEFIMRSLDRYGS
jgi:hypothetical protein